MHRTVEQSNERAGDVGDMEKVPDLSAWCAQGRPAVEQTADDRRNQPIRMLVRPVQMKHSSPRRRQPSVGEPLHHKVERVLTGAVQRRWPKRGVVLVTVDLARLVLRARSRGDQSAAANRLEHTQKLEAGLHPPKILRRGPELSRDREPREMEQVRWLHPVHQLGYVTSISGGLTDAIRRRLQMTPAPVS